MTRTQYYIFDNELWLEGYFYNCIAKDDSLIFKEEKNNCGIYISSYLDSGEKETIWGRMRMNINMSGDSLVKFSYFANDSDEIVFDKKKISISSLIYDENIDIQEKLYILNKYWVEERENPTDIFLFKAKGRYLYFKIELVSYDGSIPSVKKLRIDFPANSIIDYLPQLYRDYDYDNFTKRFLGIFQSKIFDLQEEIDEITKYFDVDSTKDEFLEWIAQWVAVDNSYIWKKDKLRNLIKKSVSLYKKKGTKDSLYKIVEFYTGTRPIIIETFEILKYLKQDDLDSDYIKLYGNDIYSFYILVDNSSVGDYRQFTNLRKIVDSFKPINTTANIIILKPSIILGQHSYISINSRISSNLALKLDRENATLPFSTTIFD